MFQFTKWLPAVVSRENQLKNTALDDDLTGWMEHFDKLSIRYRIKRNTITGQVALFIEGVDAVGDRTHWADHAEKRIG